MRRLYKAEERAIENLAYQELGLALDCRRPIVWEHRGAPDANDADLLLNRDFTLEFYESHPECQISTALRSALPGSLGGADLALAVNVDDLCPIRFELMFGSAIPRECFQPYIRQIRAYLAAHWERCCSSEPRLDERASLGGHVWVVGPHICFLWHSLDFQVEVDRDPSRSFSSHDGSFDVYIAEGTHKCVEGWVSLKELGESPCINATAGKFRQGG